MSVSLSQELLDRLVCAKYLFVRSCEELDRGGHFSSGIAILGLQDSVELILRVAAEYLHASLKESATFNQILDAVDEKIAVKLSHRSALNQLNKARVNFKHYGLEPTRHDVLKFRKDLEVFLPATVQKILGVDFEDVSLVRLIGHSRTENYLREAEGCIDQNNYLKAISACSVAFALFRRGVRGDNSRLTRVHRGARLAPELMNILHELETSIVDQRELLNTIMDGIDLADFRKFRHLAPDVTFSRGGIPHVRRRHGDVATREDALFCFRFTLDSILAMKRNGIGPQPGRREKFESQFKITKKVPAIVVPGVSPLEKIRDVEVGEVFVGGEGRYEGYVKILLEGEAAFVERGAVEKITEQVWGRTAPNPVGRADS